jgi:hypothetical protein
LPQHGAYALERRWVEGKLSRSMRRLVNRLRFEYALAKGFPSWASTPAGTRDMIDNAIRQRLLAARSFGPFWSGEIPAKRFDTVSENLRRALADLGEDTAPSPDVAEMLTAMWFSEDEAGNAGMTRELSAGHQFRVIGNLRANYWKSRCVSEVAYKGCDALITEENPPPLWFFDQRSDLSQFLRALRTSGCPQRNDHFGHGSCVVVRRLPHGHGQQSMSGTEIADQRAPVEKCVTGPNQVGVPDSSFLWDCESGRLCSGRSNQRQEYQGHSQSNSHNCSSSKPVFRSTAEAFLLQPGLRPHAALRTVEDVVGKFQRHPMLRGSVKVTQAGGAQDLRGGHTQRCGR